MLERIVEYDCEFHLPHYNGKTITITSKNGSKLCEIHSNGILHINKGFVYHAPKHLSEALSWRYPLILQSALVALYNKCHGYNFYSHKDIDIIVCNEMKLAGVVWWQRKCWYWLRRVGDIFAKY